MCQWKYFEFVGDTDSKPSQNLQLCDGLLTECLAEACSRAST